MGLFTKFKMLFNKSISLLPHQRNDVVSFVKLRNGMLKIGSEVLVNEDYNLVAVYFNKVCDILNPGEYKADEVSFPKLFRHSKLFFSKKGLFTPKTVAVDLYYVCVRPFKHVMFKTPEKIVAIDNDKKVKLKLSGTFTMQITDVQKLMKALSNDYAVIKNKKAIRDIVSTIGFKISKILNSKHYSLADYMANKEKISETLNLEINALIKKYGLSAQEFFINEVKLPKKIRAEVDVKQKQKTENDDAEIVKMVEERLNHMEKDLSMVYAEKASSTKEQTENNSSQNNMQSNQTGGGEESIFIIDDNTQIKSKKRVEKTSTAQSSSASANSSWQEGSQSNWQGTSNTSYTEFNFSSEPQPEPIIIEEIKPAEPPDPMVESNIDDDFIDDVIDKIEKRKKQKKRDRLAEILTQADVTFGKEKSSKVLNIKPAKKCATCGNSLNSDAKFCSKCGSLAESLKVCACCGAKNFPNATNCCVCKSSLD